MFGWFKGCCFKEMFKDCFELVFVYDCVKIVFGKVEVLCNDLLEVV